MKPSLLFISHVNPNNPRSGQQQRVLYCLKAARNFFNTTFLTLGVSLEEVLSLRELCDEVITLPPVLFTRRNRILYALPYAYFAIRTGLKRSNFVIGEVEFSPERLSNAISGRKFDSVIFEYWHAYKSVTVFRRRGSHCILDMHDVLWKAFEQQVKTKRFPAIYKERVKRLYRKYEERAWNSFDRIISLNKIEQNMAKNVVSPNTVVDFLPMGVDLKQWEYIWKNDYTSPYRIGFYGGLSSKVNIESALRCLDKIMPAIWNKAPTAEFWLIGNHPADVLLRRAKADSRIKVTGYLENVKEVIAYMGVILCPWKGVFGFRSRLIEVMAVGAPLVVSEDAVAGMGIAECAIRIGQTDDEIAAFALEILENKDLAQQFSWMGRKNVELDYSYEGSYLNYFENLAKLVKDKVND